MMGRPDTRNYTRKKKKRGVNPIVFYCRLRIGLRNVMFSRVSFGFIQRKWEYMINDISLWWPDTQ